MMFFWFSFRKLVTLVINQTELLKLRVLLEKSDIIH